MTECVLKDNAMATNNQDDKRRRGLSITSQGTNGSIGEDEQVMFKSVSTLLEPDPMSQPCRQPEEPPEDWALGKHNGFHPRPGFFKFLKEHVSPTHSRVNSAGRIVPSGPNSPPPTFRVDLIDQILQYADEATPGSEPAEASTMQLIEAVEVTEVEDGKPKVKDTNTGAVEEHNTDKVEGSLNVLTKDIDAGPGIGNSSVAPILNQTSTQIAVKEGSSPPLIPPGGEVIGVHIDGTLIISLEGGVYRLSSRGGFPFLEPCHNPFQPVQASMFQPSMAIQPVMPFQQLYPFQQVPSLQQFAMVQQAIPQAMSGTFYPPMPNHTYGADVFHTVQEPLPSMHLRYPVDGLVSFEPQMATQSQIQDLSAQHQAVGAELKKVEKNIALNELHFSPMELVQVTSRRKELIEKLDEIRKAKNHLERLSHMSTQALAHAELPAAEAAYPLFPGQQTFTEKTAAYSRVEPNDGRLGNRTAQANSYGHESGRNAHMRHTRLKDGPANGGSKQPFSNASKNLSPNAPAFVPSAGASSAFNQTPARALQSTGRDSAADSFGSAYPSLSPVREVVVEDEEAAYCDEMGYNDPNDPNKMYCSRPAEFRDAIYHVRDHAKRYGCKGGQSKDPEWDAEQDIRLAMHNKQPIPMPPWTRDYVSNPRPWDWADSYFNVRKDHDANWSPPRYPQYSGKGKSPEVVPQGDKTQSPSPFIDPHHRRKDSWDLPTTPWEPVDEPESPNNGPSDEKAVIVDGIPGVETDEMVERRVRKLIGSKVVNSWKPDFKANFIAAFRKTSGPPKSVAPVEKPAAYRQPYAESVTDEGSVGSGSRVRTKGVTAETPSKHQAEWMDRSGGTKSQKANGHFWNGNGYQMGQR